MSKIEQNLIICLPEYIVAAGQTETLHSPVYPCPHCNGKGKFEIETGRDKFCENKCRICNGTGKIKAVITIMWSETD